MLFSPMIRPRSIARVEAAWARWARRALAASHRSARRTSRSSSRSCGCRARRSPRRCSRLTAAVGTPLHSDGPVPAALSAQGLHDSCTSCIACGLAHCHAQCLRWSRSAYRCREPRPIRMLPYATGSVRTVGHSWGLRVLTGYGILNGYSDVAVLTTAVLESLSNIVPTADEFKAVAEYAPIPIDHTPDGMFHPLVNVRCATLCASIAMPTRTRAHMHLPLSRAHTSHFLLSRQALWRVLQGGRVRRRVGRRATRA